LGERDFLKEISGGKQDANELMDKFEAQLDHIIDQIVKNSNETQRTLVFNRRTKRNTISISNQIIDEFKIEIPTESPKSTVIPRLHPPPQSLQTSYKIVPSLVSSSATAGEPSRRNSSEVEQRNLKLSSSFKCDTTSSKPSKEIKKKIVSAALKCSLQCEKVSHYLFKLYNTVENENQVMFDIEVVKMKGFKNLKGLKFRRLEGDIWEYKTIASNFLTELNL